MNFFSGMKMWQILGFLFIDPIFLLFGSNKEKEETPTPLEITPTEVGTPIPILFGTRQIKNPILVWYGDVKILKVKVDAGAKK